MLFRVWVAQVLVWNLADADGGALLAGAAAGASPAPDSGRRASRLGAQLRLQARAPARRRRQRAWRAAALLSPMGTCCPNA